jgi:putative DNA primase/helicase
MEWSDIERSASELQSQQSASINEANTAAVCDGFSVDRLRGNGEPSEDTIALAFTSRYRDKLRFDHDAGRWYEWDGTRWKPDTRFRAFHYARELSRDIGEQKRALCKASVAGGAERFARSAPEHSVTSEVWDSNPMLLGTPSGTIDLTSGRRIAPDPGQHITKLTSIGPADGPPTRWLSFLAEALGRDDETIAFIKRWAGYCLTGTTREHTLLFAYGPGGNGKSVFLNTVAAILGDYATTAAMDTFTASRNERHSTELAMLRGARLVTASETEEGRKWADARVKQLTGGDPITARFMRKDFFTFRPAFKLMIAGNHMPVLSNVDEAMKRRLAIVPFIHKPPEPDLSLEDRLRAEHGQILAWAIEGCLEWQRDGLGRPNRVSAATAEYFDDQDLFAHWLEERCIQDGIGSMWELPAKLYRDWCDYAKAAGEDPGPIKSMKPKLERNGFPAAKTMGLRVYRGLKLKHAP